MVRSNVHDLKNFFSTPKKPITNQELIDFRRADPQGFDDLATLAGVALEKEGH